MGARPTRPGKLHASGQDPVLIEGGHVAGHGRADVLLQNGRITAVKRSIVPPSGSTLIDADGLHVLPGWIDLQVNDIEWLAGGAKLAREHALRAREVLAYQAARGTTGLVLATLASPLEEVDAYLAGLRLVLDATEPLDTVLLGGLVEGTFMNPAFHGAQNPRWVLPPSHEVLERLLSSGAVRMLNVAPEASAEACDVIRAATERGVTVGVGHAKPNALRVREAIDAGLRYVIHFGNGPTGSSLKGFADGGLLEEGLRNDLLMLTVILDGVHVHPQIVRDWIERKGLERVAGVSDSGFAMGPPSGEFEVFGVPGRPAKDGEYLEVVRPEHLPPPNPLSSDVAVLFGSAIEMRDVFANALNLLSEERSGVYYRHHDALGLEEAVAAASILTAGSPARLLGLHDRGAIAEGLRADVILAEIRGGPGSYRVDVRNVWVGA